MDDLSFAETQLIQTLRQRQPECYQDTYFLLHFSPVNETHILRLLPGKPTRLGKLTLSFYNAFIELKKWLGIHEATFLVALNGDYCQVINFDRED